MLLLITDDGIFNQKMTNPLFHVPKTYEFAAMGTLNEEKLSLLSKGVLLTGSSKVTSGAQVTVTEQMRLRDILPALHPDMQEKLRYNLPDHPVVCGRITISEGRKRQIRRMLKAVGCCVIFLKRISMGDLVLDPELQPGEYKELPFLRSAKNS